MEALAANVDSPVTTICQRTSTCKGVNCILMDVPLVGTLDLDVGFEVCENPPRMDVFVMDSSNDVLLEQSFTGSDTVVINLALLVPLTLNVVIENRNYSMITQVDNISLTQTAC